MVLLILNRATKRLLLLVTEKEPPLLTVINLYMTLHETNGSI